LQSASVRQAPGQEGPRPRPQGAAPEPPESAPGREQEVGQRLAKRTV